MRRKRWNWLGLLKREGENDGLLKVGGREEDQKLLGEGQSRKSETKLSEWKSWEVAKAVAQDRKCWSDSVEALCAYWRDET